MALLGKIEGFDPKKEDWRQYLERLEEFFAANDLSGESESKAVKRRATFISLIGPEPYKLLRSLLSPDKPKDKTFEEPAAVLTKHYTPKPSKVVQSFRFFSRVRQHGKLSLISLQSCEDLQKIATSGARSRECCGTELSAYQRRCNPKETAIRRETHLQTCRGTGAGHRGSQQASLGDEDSLQERACAVSHPKDCWSH